MTRVSKELADQLVLDIFSAMSKLPNTKKEFAQESMEIMDNPIDNSIISGILLLKARPKIISDKEEDLQLSVASALSTFLDAFNKESVEEVINHGFDRELVKHLKSNHLSARLDFALMQFVQAWNEVGRLEKKYPNVMELM
jgi:hypothetical protein